MLIICDQIAYEGPEFYTNNCRMTVYDRKVAQQILKNLLFEENTLSAVWFDERHPGWSKKAL